MLLSCLRGWDVYKCDQDCVNPNSDNTPSIQHLQHASHCTQGHMLAGHWWSATILISNLDAPKPFLRSPSPLLRSFTSFHRAPPPFFSSVVYLSMPEIVVSWTRQVGRSLLRIRTHQVGLSCLLRTQFRQVGGFPDLFGFQPLFICPSQL